MMCQAVFQVIFLPGTLGSDLIEEKGVVFATSNQVILVLFISYTSLPIFVFCRGLSLKEFEENRFILSRPPMTGKVFNTGTWAYIYIIYKSGSMLKSIKTKPCFKGIKTKKKKPDWTDIWDWFSFKNLSLWCSFSHHKNGLRLFSNIWI